MNCVLTLLKMLLSCLNKLEGDQLEATLLEPADDLSDETALEAIGL